jgi:hypothetical protein
MVACFFRWAPGPAASAHRSPDVPCDLAARPRTREARGNPRDEAAAPVWAVGLRLVHEARFPSPIVSSGMTAVVPLGGLRLMLLVLPVLLGAACGDFGAGLGFADDAAESSNVGAPALTTPGCAPDRIAVRGAERCASCSLSGDDEAVVICGVPETAVCETRQNSDGLACQLCIGVNGDILFDDCFPSAAAARMNAQCETSDGSGDDEGCTTCFDAAGTVVLSACGPRTESCVESQVDGVACRVCTANGVQVSSTCPALDLDPRSCTTYGDTEGRCIDCFDDDGALLSHQCTATGREDSLACSQTVQPEGLVCTECIDAGGAVVSRSCAPALPQPQRCAELGFREQTCLMCVDADDVVVRVECRRNDCVSASTACRVDADCPTDFACFDGTCVPAQGNENDDGPEAVVAPCEPPPPCENLIDDAGDVCRACPSAEGTTQTLCMPASRLVCESMLESQLPPEPENDSATSGEVEGDDTPPPLGRQCTLCRDAPTGVEVYRDCEGNGAIAPPSCSDGIDVGDEMCSVCSDAVTGDAVYRSCPTTTCADMVSSVLWNADGTRLVYDGPLARVTSATCEFCRSGDAHLELERHASFEPRCVVDNPCTNGSLEEADPAVPCPVTAGLTVVPRRCGVPWQGYVDAEALAGAGVHAERRGLLSFLLAADVFVVSIGSAAGEATEACDGCNCPRGDRLSVEVWANDLTRTAALLGDLVEP